MPSSNLRHVPISELMTRRVRVAGPEQELQEIWQILVSERCHHIPIVEDGRPVGIISTHDLVRVARRHGARKLSAGLVAGETARSIMTTQLETIQSDEPVEAAIDRIGLGEFHALVVLDDDDRLAGIVTNHDLLDYLVD